MQKNTINTLLPDGSNPDICTRAGAHSFIQYPGPFNFFTANIARCNEIRQNAKQKCDSNKPRKLTGQEEQLLHVTYLGTEGLAENSDPRIFAKIPKAEIECWMDHVMEQLSELKKDPTWIQTGKLAEMHDVFLISSCIPMFMHPVPVRLALDKGFFEVLADFVTSRKAPLMPCSDIAESITMLVSNVVCSVVFDQDQKICISVEKVFKKLEACGMLAQYIRCSTVNTPGLIGNIGVLKVYDELIKCSALIKKKFAIGQPCGDVVHSILHGTNYSKKNTALIKKLKTIMSFADMMQYKTQPNGAFKSCRYCNKSGESQEFQKSLKQCSRCKMTYYCSKECQKADWKVHKTTCMPTSKATNKTFEASQNAVLNFCQKHYTAIMKRIVKVCDETGLKKAELLLELDIKPNDKSGITPAFKNPPEFKIAEARGYFEGSRPNEPDWFYKKEDYQVYQENIRPVVTSVKDHFSRMTKNHLLCLIRHPGSVSCYKLQLAEPHNGNEMFSDDAVAAARSAIVDDDCGPLSKIFHVSMMRTLREDFCGLSMPSESEMDAVRMMLNANFGADFPLSGDMRR